MFHPIDGRQRYNRTGLHPKKPEGVASGPYEASFAWQRAFAATSPGFCRSQPTRLDVEQLSVGELNSAIDGQRMGEADYETGGEPKGHKDRKDEAYPAMKK
jgi:hypothetical protein